MKVSIIGAGAAGCFCAIELKRRRPGIDVTVYEAGAKPLAKVAVTGGGRCNLTNSFAAISRLAEAYPRGEQVMKRALRAFSQQDTMEWFEREGVALLTQDDECVFPVRQDAMQIVRTLERLMLVNWLDRPESEARQILEACISGNAKKFVANAHPEGMTERLWLHLLQRSGIRGDLRWQELGGKSINRLVNLATTSWTSSTLRRSSANGATSCQTTGYQVAN